MEFREQNLVKYRKKQKDKMDDSIFLWDQLAFERGSYGDGFRILTVLELG